MTEYSNPKDYLDVRNAKRWYRKFGANYSSKIEAHRAFVAEHTELDPNAVYTMKFNGDKSVSFLEATLA